MFYNVCTSACQSVIAQFSVSILNIPKCSVVIEMIENDYYDCKLYISSDMIYLFIWGFMLLSTLYRSYHDG